MQLTVEVVTVIAGATSVLGVLALVAYFYLYQKVRALEGSEFRSVRQVVEGDGIFNADQVIEILQTFGSDSARLAALKELAKVQKHSADGASRVYSKIKSQISVTELEKQRFTHIRRLTVSAAPFFFLIALSTVTYGAYSNPEIATAIREFISGKGGGSGPSPSPSPKLQHLGTVTITPKILAKSQETSTHPRVQVSGKGQNSTYPAHFAIAPDLAKQGWKIDVEKLVANRDWWTQDRGEGGSSCTGVDRNTIKDTEFTFNIQLGRNKDMFHEWDAYQYCNLNAVPLIRTIERQDEASPVTRDLSWNADELVVLPDNTVSYVMKLAVDGYPERILNESSASPFDFLDIKRENNRILFQPKPASKNSKG
ncbi:hypothetical protein [Bradyrhizobium genomosp. I (2014)]|uniref:hypothetical protein n=1 Tax=Bradyrhizobium genomosp. I (2014) TaxID=2683269 RepID=UPI0004B4835B|nr:hypothetical protein [Bradyrhizobium sp. CCBAU 43298]